MSERFLFEKLRKVQKRVSGFAFCDRLGISPPPLSVHLYLTFRCNLKCKVCPQREESRSYQGGEMDFNDWKSVIDQVSEFKPEITLIGGEPLLHKDFLRVASYVRDKNLECLVFTNGYFVEDIAEDLVKNQLHLTVSLDGSKEIHDVARGLEGSFERLKRGIRRYQEFRRSYKYNHLKVRVNSTISGVNCGDLLETVGVCEQLGVDHLNIQHLMFNSPEREMASQKILNSLLNHKIHFPSFGIKCADPDVGELIRQYSIIGRHRGEMPVSFLPELNPQQITEYYSNTAPSFVKDRICERPWRIASIHPNGDIVACFDYSFGNVKKQPFKNIWNSQRARKFRKMLRKIKQLPICFRCCGLYVDY